MEHATEHPTLQDDISCLPPFLRIPPSLRQRIYLAAGILGRTRSSRFIDLNSRGAPDSNWDRADFIVTYRLLLTCRTIYEEVGAEVYASHRFFIRYHVHGNLGALSRLHPPFLRALTVLTIHLNVASCGLGMLCDHHADPCFEPDPEELDKPLSISEPAAKGMLREWHRTWDECIRPNLLLSGRLKLNFVCDAADFETGLTAAQPFLAASQKPFLAGCSVRLSHRPDADLRKLAERAVAASTGESQPITNNMENNVQAPFRFLDLPAELRLQILSYTDLVTPFGEIEWDVSRGFYIRYWREGGYRSCDPINAHGHYGTLNPSWREEPTPYLACWESSDSSGCYCAAYHAAHSSIRRCMCWAPPTQLVLVSRQMREDALRTFYGQNRFIVVPTGGVMRDAVSASPARLPAAVFLERGVPHDAFRFLRHLEIVFPAFGQEEPCAYCPLESAEWHDWNRTLESVKDKLDVSKLTLRVWFAWWYPGIPRNYSLYRRHLDEVQSEEIIKSYLATIKPLEKLRGLRQFFAHLPNPLDLSIARKKGASLMMPTLEQEVERRVMGNHYDSEALGKWEAAPSRWLVVHERLDEIIRNELDARPYQDCASSCSRYRDSLSLSERYCAHQYST